MLVKYTFLSCLFLFTVGCSATKNAPYVEPIIGEIEVEKQNGQDCQLADYPF